MTMIASEVTIQERGPVGGGGIRKLLVSPCKQTESTLKDVPLAFRPEVVFLFYLREARVEPVGLDDGEVQGFTTLCYLIVPIMSRFVRVE